MCLAQGYELQACIAEVYSSAVTHLLLILTHDSVSDCYCLVCGSFIHIVDDQ
jgi:hypothetical protein